MLQTIYPRAGLSRRQGANQLGRHLQAERLGHATVSITLETYSHAIPAMQEEAALRIAELLFADLEPAAGRIACSWAAVACGYDFSLAVKQDGTLWAWGHNYVGQLGLGDTTTRLTLWAWGFNGNGELGLGDSTDRWIPTQLASGGP